MTEDLKRTTIRGAFWSSADRFSHQLVGFVVSVILARLLLPADFGLMAMLTIFIAVSQVLIAGGFGSALIQKKDATLVDECSVFFFNLLVSVLIAGGLVLCAPAIADFYGMPLLAPMMRFLSLSLVINAFGLIQVSLMIKRLDFRKQTKVSLASTIGSGVVGVAMAMTGFGVWSLVWQTNAASLLRVILLWKVHRWRPAWKFSFESLRRLFAFGSNLLIIGVVDTLFKNVYLMVIGKAFSAGELGLYARAQSIQQLPVKDIAITADLVSFPAFSSIQHDKARMKRGLRQGLAMQALLSFPIMVGLACVAEPLVRVLLTDKWLSCVPYLQLLCLGGFFYPLSVLNVSALKAQGRSDLFLRLEIIKKALILIAIAVTYRHGMMAMVAGQVITSWTGYYLNSHYTARFLDYPLKEQLADVLPIVGAAGLMGLGVYLVGLLEITSPAIMLGLQVCFGIALYVALCRSFRLAPFMESIRMIESKWMAYRKAGCVLP